MNVLDAATKRIERIFAEFDNVYVSFSGGKDSGVLLNLTASVAERLNRSFSVLHLDYEAQYQATTAYVDDVQAAFQGDFFRCCVPFRAATATSMHETHWRPWDPQKKHLWVRPMPEHCHTEAEFDFFRPEMTDYDFQEAFAPWLHARNKAQRTACMVGIRAQESLNRWRAVYKGRESTYAGLSWTVKQAQDVYNCYPIFDWQTEDIWRANGTFGWTYNRLYDLMHMAGVPLHQMRVASPFHGQATSSLALYRAIEPDTWGKLVSRVNGVNFTGIYGGTTAMGWRSIQKPEHFTWQQYCLFLLSTLPEQTAANYRQKLETSIRFWRERGGTLHDDVANDLQRLGAQLQPVKSSYGEGKTAYRMEYLDDADITAFQSVPTWKRMCVCILKNDHLCKYMGFAQTKQEMERRKAIVEKYKNIL